MKTKRILIFAVILSLLAVCSAMLFGCGLRIKHVHSYSDEIIPATCSSEGYTYHICECGDRYADSYTPKAPHTPITDAAVPATCKETGLSEGSHCGVCNEVLTEQTVTDKSDHKPIIDSPAEEPTCLAEGRTEKSHCGVCNAILSTGATVSVKEHTYENDICTSCHNYRPTEGLTYTVNSNGIGCTLTGAENVTGTVHVAAIYEGKRVTAIGDRAFLNNMSVTNITLPDGIQRIGKFAFGGCPALGELILPDSVSEIDDCAFSTCYSLDSISIPKNVRKIGKGILRACTAMTSVTVDEDNAVYHASGNCIIETAGKRLVAGCGASVIPSDGSVTAIGDSAFEVCRSLTEIVIPAAITSIGENAFENCGITEIKIPSGITELGKSIFCHCMKLESVTLSDGLKAISESMFYHCPKLAEIEFPASVTIIGKEAFAECGFASLVVPQTVTSIGDGAFAACTSLESITVPFVGSRGDATTASSDTVFGHIFGSRSYSGCVAVKQTYRVYNTIALSVTSYIPPSLKSVTVTGGKILYGAFENCTMLESITLPDDLDSIGPYAFEKCTGLEEITIPGSVKTIDRSAFAGCTGIKSIVLPDGLEKAESSAFNGCTALEEATIPAIALSCMPQYYIKRLYVTSGESIGESAFNGFSSLETVELADSITSIGESAFRYCQALTSVKLPAALTAIPAQAFEHCIALTDIDLSNITSIGNHAFNGCRLLDVEIPDGVLTLGNYALSGTAYINNRSHYRSGLMYAGRHLINSNVSEGSECVIRDGTLSVSAFAFENSLLASVTIPASVTKIGMYAFRNCTKLSSARYLSSIDDWCKIEFISAESNPLLYADDFYVNGELLTELNISNGVTAIGDYAFVNRKFATVELPDTVTSVGWYAFENCSFTRFVGRGLETIGMYAFSGCTALEEITLGDAVKTVGVCAFKNCSSLKGIVISAGAEEIGSSAFEGCGALESMTLPFVGNRADATAASQSTFFGYIFGTASYEGSIMVTQRTSDFSKEYYTYYVPENLSSVTITGGQIQPGAFRGCSNLTAVKITGTVDYIGGSAFYNCFNLAGVEIGANVNYIGSEAFLYCDKLKTAVFAKTDGWTCYEYSNSTIGAAISSSALTNHGRAAELLSKYNYKNSPYAKYVWKRAI